LPDVTDVILIFGCIVSFFSFNFNSVNQREGEQRNSTANKQTLSFLVISEIATAYLEGSFIFSLIQALFIDFCFSSRLVT
jgi:hypothetical protein